MSVYVDSMMPCVRNKNWKYDEACHLMADDEDELTRFAVEKLRLKPGWIQRKGKSTVHFDLTKSKRAQAVAAGAVELTHKEITELWQGRQTGEQYNG